jgi:hypothetical protein
VKYTFVLDERDAQTIVNALADLPYKAVAELLTSLMQQVSEQRQSAPDHAPPQLADRAGPRQVPKEASNH